MKRKMNTAIDSDNLQEPMSLGHQYFEKGATASDLRSTPSHDEFILIVEDLKITNTLLRLSFSGCALDHEFLLILVAGFKENKTLLVLAFFECHIGDQGALALADAIKENTTLPFLHLGFNQIGDEGAKALAKAVAASTTLQEIGLYANKIGDNGAQALADAMLNNVALQNLDLNGNDDISDTVKDGHWTHYPVAKLLLDHEGDGSQSTWDQLLVALAPVHVPYRSRIAFD